MNDSGNPNDPQRPVTVTSIAILCAHLLWFFLGPMILLVLLWGIVAAGSGWVTVLDVVFIALVVVMIGCRWIEQRSGQATTDTGEPSTWDDFHRYVMIMPWLAAAAWGAANLFGNHIVGGGGS